MAIPDAPLTRAEQYLNRIATDSGTIPDEPLTRVEQYLDYIAKNGSGGGGGGSVTPEQFGAKGDGTTDDTAAIQAAFDSGESVVFGNGKTYKITAPIILDSDAQRVGLQYNGHGCTISHAASDAFCVSSNKDYGLKQCVIEGFNFASSGMQYKGIFVNSISGSNYLQECEIKRCTFNMQSQGIYLGGYRVNVELCYFVNCNYGINDDAANNAVIQNNYFIGCDIGLQANIPQFSLFSVNKFHACDVGLRADGRLPNGVLCGSVFEGNSFSTGANAVSRHIKLNNLNGIEVAGNFADGGARYALELTNCDNAKIDGFYSLDGAVLNFHNEGYGKNVVLDGVVSKSIGVGAVDADVNLQNCTATLVTVNTTSYPQSGRYINVIDCKLVKNADGTDGRLGSGVEARLKNASIDAPTARFDYKTIGSNTYQLAASGSNLVWAVVS